MLPPGFRRVASVGESNEHAMTLPPTLAADRHD
jgi:hypothetical protein